MRRILLVSYLSFLVPSIAMASSSSAFDLWKTDATQFQNVLQQDAGDEAQQSNQTNAEKGTELFPDLTTQSGSQQTGALPALDPFVTFKESGVTVVLKDVPRQE